MRWVDGMGYKAAGAARQPFGEVGRNNRGGRRGKNAVWWREPVQLREDEPFGLGDLGAVLLNEVGSSHSLRERRYGDNVS
jgi:hypothetical protein